MLDDKKLIVLNPVKSDEKFKRKKLYLLIKFYLLLYSPLYHSWNFFRFYLFVFHNFSSCFSFAISNNLIVYILSTILTFLFTSIIKIFISFISLNLDLI